MHKEIHGKDKEKETRRSTVRYFSHGIGMILKGLTIHGHRAKHTVASLLSHRVSVRMVGSDKARVP